MSIKEKEKTKEKSMENTTYQANPAPVAQLKTNRGLGKFILLTIVTLGIYSIVYFSSIIYKYA